MIQTSYFASKAPKGRKVCIAKWNKFWNGARAMKFAPSNPKATDWKGAFRADLEKRFPTVESLRDYLAEIERETPNPILCCYEVDRTECHRHILADFIEKMLGIKVTEWEPDTPKQGSLI